MQKFVTDDNKNFTDNIAQDDSSVITKNNGFWAEIHNSMYEIFFFDAETLKFINASKGALKNIGFSREELINLTPLQIKPEFDLASFRDLILPIQNNSEEKIVFTTMHRRKDGTTYPTEIHLELLLCNDKPTFVAIALDVSVHTDQRKELESMAYYDPLTKLPNRALFSDRLKQSIAQSKRNGSLLAVCFLDLDEFKPVNDNFGHSVGDQLLVEIAQRLQQEIREEDTVSRLGGDEFTILLTNIQSIEQCKQMLERIYHSISQLYYINGYSFSITASTGVTLYPLDDSDAYELISHADQAMYHAKTLGKNRYFIFDSSKKTP